MSRWHDVIHGYAKTPAVPLFSVHIVDQYVFAVVDNYQTAADFDACVFQAELDGPCALALCVVYIKFAQLLPGRVREDKCTVSVPCPEAQPDERRPQCSAVHLLR